MYVCILPKKVIIKLKLGTYLCYEAKVFFPSLCFCFVSFSSSRTTLIHDHSNDFVRNFKGKMSSIRVVLQYCASSKLLFQSLFCKISYYLIITYRLIIKYTDEI